MELAHELLSRAWLIAGIAALCVGLAKAGLAGFGMPIVLLMAEVLPARESTGVVLPLLIVGDCFAVAAYRHHAQWRYIRRLFLPALVGIVAGYFLMGLIPDRMFKHVLGWIIIALTVLQWARGYFKEETVICLAHTPVFTNTMGGLGGASTMMANAAGPVMSLFFLAVNLPKYELIGTSAWFFLIINVTKLPFSAHLGLINANSLALTAMLAPLVVIGIGIGKAVIHLIPQKLFEWLLLIFALGGGLRLILS